MMITPQAQRRITGAVAALDSRARDQWGTWTAAAAPDIVRTDVPYEIAMIAHNALVDAARRIQERLEGSGLDDDTEADLLNDLGFVQAIESSLRREGIGR